MNSPRLFPRAILAAPVCLGALFVGDAPVSATQGSIEPIPQASEEKDHVLFLGLNLFVTSPGQTARVERVSKSSVEVVEGDSVRTVPLSVRRDYQIMHEPKVSEFSVTLDQLSEVRAYSVGRDQAMDVLRQQLIMDALQAERTDAVIRDTVAVMNAQQAVTAAEGAAGSPDGADRLRSAQQDLASAQTDLMKNEGLQRGTAGMNPVTDGWGDPNAPHDTLDVTFRISSPVVLEDAYAVLISSLRLPTKPESIVRAIKLQPLPTISQKPRTVSIRQEGLPLGFDVGGTEIHVYAGGREIATNISPRRVELNDTEAMQYLLMQYVVTHRRQDLPPKLMTQFLPIQGRDQIALEQLSRDVRLRVNPNGVVIEVQLIPEGMETTDRYIEKLVREARFYPALSDGDPVTGEVTLTLASFVR